MNDNTKACKTCMHYDSGIWTGGAFQHICRNPDFQGWDLVFGETIPYARTARQDEMMCGVFAVGHEKKRSLHDRISAHWHGVIFGASLLLIGLGIVVAVEGTMVGGGLMAGLFGYTTWWGYQGLPEK